MLKKVLFLSALSLSTLVYPESKAFFDLGSGKFALLVVEIEPDNTSVKHSESAYVFLGKDLVESQDQRFSKEVQEKAVQVLKELKETAEKKGATKFQGTATAAFREAKNGEELLQTLKKETGIDLRIISQEEEGILGFSTTMAFLPELDPKKSIFWDVGAGSFQIVAQNEVGHDVYEGSFGAGLLAKIFLEEVARPLPKQVTIQTCQDFIRVLQSKLTAPLWLTNKLLEKDVKVVATSGGSQFSIFSVAEKYVGASCFSKDQVKSCLENICKAQEQNIDDIGRLCFLYAMMDKFGITEVTLKKKVSGNYDLN